MKQTSTQTPASRDARSVIAHTGKRWHVELGRGSDGAFYIRDHRNRLIAKLDTASSTKDEENAPLLAAAPDLLRELQDFVNRWTKYPRPPKGKELDIYLDNARAAIKRATEREA